MCVNMRNKMHTNTHTHIHSEKNNPVKSNNNLYLKIAKLF